MKVHTFGSFDVALKPSCNHELSLESRFLAIAIVNDHWNPHWLFGVGVVSSNACVGERTEGELALAVVRINAVGLQNQLAFCDSFVVTLVSWVEHWAVGVAASRGDPPLG